MKLNKHPNGYSRNFYKNIFDSKKYEYVQGLHRNRSADNYRTWVNLRNAIVATLYRLRSK